MYDGWGEKANAGNFIKSNQQEARLAVGSASSEAGEKQDMSL